eukprot:scaffold98_cov172-Amphora_coffeaeformis.AAC.22
MASSSFRHGVVTSAGRLVERPRQRKKQPLTTTIRIITPPTCHYRKTMLAKNHHPPRQILPLQQMNIPFSTRPSFTSAPAVADKVPIPTNASMDSKFRGRGAAATASTRRKGFRAENGADGGYSNRDGRTGKDVVIRVPPGTVVEEQVGGEDDDEEAPWLPVGSLAAEDDRLIVATGGEGGEGTGVQRQRGIANYPFTTVIPNLGVWIPGSSTEAEDDDVSTHWTKGSGKEGLVLCDVPGLIAGAADGVGLGHAFLRHVERCHVILHLVDATSNDPIADYTMLNREIVRYGTGQLAQMPQVVVVNKIDALEGRAGEDWEEGLRVKWSSREELEAQMREIMPHTRLMWMSAKEREGVEELMTRLAAFVKKVKDAKE